MTMPCRVVHRASANPSTERGRQSHRSSTTSPGGCRRKSSRSGGERFANQARWPALACSVVRDTQLPAVHAASQVGGGTGPSASSAGSPGHPHPRVWLPLFRHGRSVAPSRGERHTSETAQPYSPGKCGPPR